MYASHAPGCAPHGRRLLLLFVLAAAAAPAQAGGPWVPRAKTGYVYVGFSRKTADTIWDLSGNTYRVPGDSPFQNHDFRYLFLSGEIGVLPRLSASFVLTFLDGFEGPDGHLERNTGFSDAWVGLKYAVSQGATPMAVGLTVRTPALYDIDGPYARNLYDENGTFLGHSPEWRGLLKHDVTLSYLVGRSMLQGRGWANAEVGYTWRQGAPADQLPVLVEAGFSLPRVSAMLKLNAYGFYSLGNDSERAPDDRFGFRPGSNQNLNDQSMARVGASLIVPVGARQDWSFEAGYNQCVWGRSARQYKEPFLSVGRRF